MEKKWYGYGQGIQVFVDKSIEFLKTGFKIANRIDWLGFTNHVQDQGSFNVNEF